MPNVIRKEIVARSLARLREQKTHTLFAGYLCLQYRAAQLGRLNDLQPEFLQFFKQFFQVADHPLGTPYIKIFTERQASEKNLWLNENVAGSYAPSSLRPDQPFRKVVTIDNKTYSLPADHAARALKYLLFSKPVQVADLAVVLYRDYGLLGEAVTIEELVGIFTYEFGYANQPGAEPDHNFQALYSLQTAQNWDKDWLEVQ
jgi:hypothetical protein